MTNIKLAELPSFNDWHIGCVLNRYVKAVESVDSYTEKKALEERFVKLIKLQVINYGHVMFTEDFAEAVKEDYFTSYDGFGNYMDEKGEKHDYVDFNPLNILKKAEEFPYVCWYNK